MLMATWYMLHRGGLSAVVEERQYGLLFLPYELSLRRIQLSYLFRFLFNALAEGFRLDHLHTCAVLKDFHSDLSEICNRKAEFKRAIRAHASLLVSVPDLFLDPFAFSGVNLRVTSLFMLPL